MAKLYHRRSSSRVQQTDVNPQTHVISKKNGWQIRHSCNHWSNTDLALEYLENIKQHFHEQKIQLGMFHNLLVFRLRFFPCFFRSLFYI